MRISTISLLFGLFLCTSSYATDIYYPYPQGLSLDSDLPSNPWVLTDLSVGQIIELTEINFELDKANLNEKSKGSLSELANFLIANPTVKIEIGGHTNSIPPHKYCDNLLSDRAQVVSQYLISIGVSPANIEAKGFGKRKPKYSEFSQIGRKSNQRVEVQILSL